MLLLMVAQQMKLVKMVEQVATQESLAVEAAGVLQVVEAIEELL